MKVLLFGDSRLVLDVAKNLKDVTSDLWLVENDLIGSQEASEVGVDSLKINDDDESLISAGICDDVDVVFTLYQEESQNVFLTLAVKSLNAKVRVVCITDSDTVKTKLLAAGADKVINPYAITGMRAYRLVDRPRLELWLEKLVFSESDQLIMSEAHVGEGSRLNGLMLDELRAFDLYKVIVIGMVDCEQGAQLQLSTDGVKHILDIDDILVLMGSLSEITAFCSHFKLTLRG